MPPRPLKAPGSTFKPITAVAALEEGVIGLHGHHRVYRYLRSGVQPDQVLDMARTP
ncbi:MAG: penicillin-binding transpeptidase domain-containing protein [Enterocloster bolteae]